MGNKCSGFRKCSICRVKQTWDVFTNGSFCFVQNIWFVLDHFAYFSQVILCSHCIIVKPVKACTGFPHALTSMPQACWLRFALRWSMDIWADKHISLKLDTTHGNSNVYKTPTKWLKEKGWTHWRQQYIKRCKTTLPLLTSNLLTPVARQNRAETTSCRWSQLGCHVLHQSADCCVHICSNKRIQRGNALLFRNNISNRSRCDNTLKGTV